MHCDTVEAPKDAPNVPGGHCRQAEAETAPSKGLYVPLVQGAHILASAAPSSSLYVPELHCKHPLLLFDPTVGPYVPAGHSKQVAELDLLLYCPAGHGMHCDPAGLTKVPGAHKVTDWHNAIPAAAVVVPGGQGEQAELL